MKTKLMTGLSRDDHYLKVIKQTVDNNLTCYSQYVLLNLNCAIKCNRNRH